MSARRPVRDRVLAGNMDINKAFESLYKSIVQGEENDDVECSQKSSTADIATSSQNSSSSPQKPLEMLGLYSKRLSTESRQWNHDKSVLSTEKRENISLVYISGTGTKSSTASNQKTASSVKIQNGGDQLYEEPDSENVYDTQSIDIQYSYERVDGYASGEAKEQSDKQYLCKECRKLFKKARKIEHSAEEIPKKPESSHWCSKFWMMMNRVSSQKRKKEQNRTLNSVVRKLRTNRQTANLCLRCCRIHSFLKRNLRLSTTTKKLFHNLTGRQKRKRTTSAQKSFQKSTAKRKAESLSCSKEKKVPSKTFVFEWDSSDEEETSLNVKRYKLLGEDLRRSRLQKPSENPLPVADFIVEPINTFQEQNSPVHADIMDSPATQDEEDIETSNERFNTNPPDSNGSVDVAGPSLFSHVQGGSFKELLQRMKMGYLTSGIVRENRI